MAEAQQRVAIRRRVQEVIPSLRRLTNPSALQDAWKLENDARALTPATRMPKWTAVAELAESLAAKWRLRI
jgi:hypothetical protein